MLLSDFLISELFAFFLVFCRMGSTIMLLPGIGESYVSTRIRLVFALMVSLVITPTVTNIPAVPTDVLPLFVLVITEIFIGLLIGGIVRLLMSVITMASMIISYQSSLASALTQDVTIAGSQGTAMGNLLGFSAIILLFATDLHHMMLRGLMESYILFSPGEFPPVKDFAEHATQTINRAFEMAMRIAGPHILMGLIVYMISGILSRLMPNMQVFFIILAPQILLSFFVLIISLSAIYLWYLDYIRAGLAMWLGGIEGL